MLQSVRNTVNVRDSSKSWYTNTTWTISLVACYPAIVKVTLVYIFVYMCIYGYIRFHLVFICSTTYQHRYRVSYSSRNYRQAKAEVASMELRLATPNRSSVTNSGVVQNKPALKLASSPWNCCRILCCYNPQH